MSNAASPLVSVDWLAANLDRPDIRIVDVRWTSRYENGKGISLDDPDGFTVPAISPVPTSQAWSRICRIRRTRSRTCWPPRIALPGP